MAEKRLGRGGGSAAAAAGGGLAAEFEALGGAVVPLEPCSSADPERARLDGPLPSVAEDGRLRGGVMAIDSLLDEVVGGLWGSRLQSVVASFCARSELAERVMARRGMT